MSSLEGKRILVLEDEPLIAMLLEDMLEEFGCVTVGPALDIAPAEALARDEPIDAAILDIHIGGRTSHSVAALLHERHIPFVIASGDGADPMPGSKGMLGKPYRAESVKAQLQELFA
jgi:DNA-binding response OmpR family regulator